MSIDFLKKKLSWLLEEAVYEWLKAVNFEYLKECHLFSIHRGGLYYKPVSISEENLTILDFLDKQYLDTPFYGSRKLVVEL